jgi:hypothetical protein
MPGVAQVWLTQKELTALLTAAPNKRIAVSPAIWSGLAPKLKEARDGLGCPVPDASPPASAQVEDEFPAFLGDAGMDIL